MRRHRRRRATRRCSTTSICPKDYGSGPSTVWALPDNEPALSKSRRLVSGSTALVTRPCPLLGQAPRPQGWAFCAIRTKSGRDSASIFRMTRPR